MTRDQTIAFLRCVLPADGFYCATVFNVAKPVPGKDFPRNVFFKTLDQLADATLSQDQLGRTVYHACASFREPTRRTQRNARLACSLWIDIDCGAGNKYPDKASAAGATLDFCSGVDLPAPVFVDSGHGIHCYWPLEQDLAPDQWYQYASGLKQLAVQQGLKIDPARTADIASILRTPGTHNRKEGEVDVLYDPDSLRRFPLQSFDGLLQTAAPRTRNDVRINQGIIGRINSGTSYGAVYADDIADRCAQVDALRRTGDIPEPHWYAVLGVLARCEDGEVKAHEWSSKEYSDYSSAGVDAKLLRARGLTGATTCSKFNDVNPGTCTGCPLQGRINSPISAPVSDMQSRNRVRAGDCQTEIIVPQLETADGEPIPKVYSPFLWSPTKQLLFTKEGGNGDREEIIVTEHQIYLAAVQTNELDRGTFSYRFRKFLPKEGWSDIIIDARTLHGNSGIADMFGKGVVVHEPKFFLHYARDAVDQFHAETETHVRYDQFGWKNDDQSFLFGKMLYTRVGPVQAIGAKEVETRSQWIGPSKNGSLEAWTEAADSLFAADMEAYSTMVLASFAAPLMRFQSMDEGGAILHLFTPGSGQGKTTALSGAWTVWGKKEGLALTNEDTRVSKPIAIGTLANLPVIYDELRDKDPEVIRRMVIMFTEGRDRMRGMVDGTIRHTKANWQTIMLSAANNSLIDQLQGDGIDAPAFRVLELSSTLPAGIDKTKGGRLQKIMNDSAGHAGDAYLRYLVQPEILAWSKEALGKWTQDIWDTTKLDSAHRFRVRAVGSIAVAAALVNKLGILHFKTDRIVQWLVNELGTGKNIGTVSASIPLDNAISAFGEFINEHYGEMLVVPDKFKAKSPKMIPLLRPHIRLSMRFEIGTARLFISQSLFHDWAIRRQYSPRMLLDMLEKNGVLLGQKRNITLSAGTDIPGAQVQCIEANTSHPVMSGMVASVVELQKPDNVSAITL